MQLFPNTRFHKLPLLLSVILLLTAFISAGLVPTERRGNEISNTGNPPTLPAGVAQPGAVGQKDPYPTDEELKKAIQVPPQNRAIFFSRITTTAVMDSFVDRGYKNVYKAFSTMTKYNDGDPDDERFKRYVDSSSRIFAEHASGEVHVILGDEIPDCTTWSRVELPTLKKNKNVSKIIAVSDKDPKKTRVIWSAGQGVGSPASGTKKCLNWIRQKAREAKRNLRRRWG